SSTTSPGRGAAGSGTSSTRTDRGPWKTAAFMQSAFDLDLDVARRVSSRGERVGSLGERERGAEQGGGVDAARGHEPNRPRPEAGGADDAPHLKRLRLDQPDLDRRAAPDVDADEDDPPFESREGKDARHRRRYARRLDDDVEAPAARRLGDLLGKRTGARIDRANGSDLEAERATMRLRLDQRHGTSHRRCDDHAQ